MATAREKKRRVKDVVDPRDATKVELVVGTLGLIGGDTRFVVLDELAIASHRLAPSVFSWPEYLWLPNLDSVRVTLVDVKRGELLEEGSEGRGHTLKGVRLSEEGRQWTARNRTFLDALRRRLPEPSRYAARPAQELAAVAVLSAGELDGASRLSRERVVAEAYRLFPEHFALAGFAGWPDSARVDQALRESAWLSSTAQGWSLKPEHHGAVERLRAELHVESPEGFGAAKRRQIKGAAQRAVALIERSPLFKRYAAEQEAALITEEDVCELLAVTLESSPETLRRHLDSMTRLVEQAERWDLVELLRWLGAWLQARHFRLIQT